MPWLAVRCALVVGLVLASSASFAAPHPPALRERSIASALPARARSAFAPLAAAGWRATWDRDTGVAARLWGSYVEVPGAIGDGTIAERAARQFLAQHVGVLAPGAQPGDFVVVANQIDNDIRTVGFAQRYRGLPVIGGELGFVFARDRLFAIGSSAWPHVSARLASGRAILPLVRNRAIAYHAVEIRDAGTGRDAVRVYVDSDGRELARESRVMTATGRLEYNAGVRHPSGLRQDFPAPSANITVNGAPSITSSTGTFTWPTTTAATVIPSLAGTYVRIVNQEGPLATTSLTVPPSGVGTWDLASDELGDAQLSTYIYGNIAKTRARIVNPSIATWLDAQLDFYVNEKGSCNAYSTGDDVHFFRKDAMCENSGRLADVVFHEFGHSLHNHSLIAGMGKFEVHLSEGLSDFFAANITGDSGVGRGFFFDDSPLRNIDPRGTERVYPMDFDFDPHISGLIIGGALWDLRKALIRQLGSTAGITRTERIFTGIMQRADDIATTFTAALIADDDDGNLGNNTPNYCAIERAFGGHGLVPGYVTTQVTAPKLDGLELVVTVETPAGTMCPPPEVVAIAVTWHGDDGVRSSFSLERAGDIWRGSFPPQPNGTVISYAVEVTFDDGNVRAFPNNPADPRYQLFTGSAVPIYCESFNADPMWPQTSNLGLEWQWAMPVIGQAGGDPPAALTGTHVLGTDLTSDGHYRSDLVVSTTTPIIDTSKYRYVHLQYWRWLTIEDALFDRATIGANNVEVWRNATSPSGTLDHVDREWRFHDIDLTPQVADGTLELTWALSSDFGKELGGWTLDDVCVVGLVKNPGCGDGELDFGEQCDDGNNAGNDGCDPDCVDEITAGGGGCCDAGGAAPSNALLVFAWLLIRRRRR
jgi:cysteine-rich repeat protein